MSKWPHVQYTDLLQRLFPLALFWQTQCNIGKKEDKLEFFMRQNYIAAVHASRAGLSDLVGPSTIAYFDLTLAFETVPFVHTLFFLHCKYFHYHKYNCSLCSNFQCPVSTSTIVTSTIHLIVKKPAVVLLFFHCILTVNICSAYVFCKSPGFRKKVRNKQ